LPHSFFEYGSIFTFNLQHFSGDFAAEGGYADEDKAFLEAKSTKISIKFWRDGLSLDYGYTAAALLRNESFCYVLESMNILHCLPDSTDSLCYVLESTNILHCPPDSTDSLCYILESTNILHCLPDSTET